MTAAQRIRTKKPSLLILPFLILSSAALLRCHATTTGIDVVDRTQGQGQRLHPVRKNHGPFSTTTGDTDESRRLVRRRLDKDKGKNGGGDDVGVSKDANSTVKNKKGKNNQKASIRAGEGASKSQSGDTNDKAREKVEVVIEATPSTPVVNEKQEQTGKTTSAVLVNPTEESPSSESDNILILLVIIALVVVGLGIRRKMKAGHGGGLGALRFGGAGGVSDDDFTYGVSTVSGGGGGVFQHRHEAVPLASTNNNNDDEWGWEDGNSGGEIELGNATDGGDFTNDIDEDDLQKALDLSLSDNVGRTILNRSSSNTSSKKGSGNSINIGVGNSASRQRKGSSGSNSSSSRQHRQPQRTTPKMKNSWDDVSSWDVDSPNTTLPKPPRPTATAVPTSVTNEVEAMLAANNAAGTTAITSLGTKTKRPVAPVKKKEEAEDIFAAMGLSSMSGSGRVPGLPPAAVRPVVSLAKGASVPLSSAWKSSNRTAQIALKDDGNEGDSVGGSDWDDDLDDLLDD